jgi:hypothetical protein
MDITKEQLITWATSPKAQAVERAALSSSGFIGAQLIHWGFPSAQLGAFDEIVIQATPVFIALAWSLYQKLEAKIVARAARILAEREHPAAPAVAQAAAEMKKPA